ncbi:Ldh family oxidoreductase [Aliidiomarina sp. Khilg15.8]
MPQVDYAELVEFSTQCLQRAGASRDVAAQTAHYLAEGDLLGFTTHGVKRLRFNVQQLQRENSRGSGDVEVIRDRAAVATWDAHFLPGPYVAPLAVHSACDKAKQAGTATIVVRRCQHVASLAAYLRIATEQGLVVSLMASTPAQQSVAPFGGREPVFSPNPFAIGVPTGGDPLLLDMSFSMTAAGKVRQAFERGQMLPWDAIVTASGELSRDPADYVKGEGAALLPLGGADLGYKGYGLCLMSEIWTMSLSNYGRLDATDDGESNTLWVQVYDPTAFGTLESFTAVTDDLIRRCRDSAPIDAAVPVRIPGERSLQRRAEQLANGVELDEVTCQLLQKTATEFDLPMPAMRA